MKKIFYRVFYKIYDGYFWIKRKRLHKLTIDCCEFNKNNRNGEVEKGKWKKLFIRICNNLGFNKKSALVLWNSIGISNNWEHLHKTEEERNRTVEEWWSNFIWDVYYCSDRWTFDRLLRVQWAYRQWYVKSDMDEM